MLALVVARPQGALAARHAPAGSPLPLSAELPHDREHSEFVVDVNRKGQVVRATSAKRSHNKAFDALTYGNAMQVFVRTQDGKAVAGVYRLSYDYNPSTKRVHRNVALVHAGGVDADAPGAVIVMGRRNQQAKADAQKHRTATSPPPGSLAPGSYSGSYTPLPSLQAITGK